MKKIFTILLACCFFCKTGKTQFVTIPDANFRAYLVSQYPSCFNASQMLDTTCALIPSIYNMYLSAPPIGDLPVISNVEGLQYFKSVRNIILCYQPITSLPKLPDSLDDLQVAYTQLTQLPELPKLMRTLYCQNNLLTSLPDSLPPNMREINCSFNYLTSLPDLGQHPSPFMTSLLCDHNDIYCFPYRSVVNSVRMDTSKIKCLPNQPYVTDEFYNLLPLLSYPVCSPLNNVNHCFINPVVIGNVFYDMNSNGIKDGTEIYKRNIRVQLSGGTAGYTDNDGQFKVFGLGMGNYSLTVIAPLYYSAPAAMNIVASDYDTIFVGDMPLKPTVSVGALAISVTPFTAARPGFNWGYWINYENVGTTTLSPDFVLDYDNTKLAYDHSTIGGVTDNGSNLSIAASSFLPGEGRTFFAQFVVDPGTTLNSTIDAKATATAGTKVAIDSTSSVVTGSYDPNDKDATPYLTTEQVNDGIYITYLVRFQNTGNDTAFNVVLTDTLSSQLQFSTMKILDASHPCKVTQKGANVLFEFLNILLPDSNVNEPMSHGFIKFKLRAKTTLPDNTTINNIADIYFDYNSPVTTNTASTIVNFTTVPLTLLSFRGYTQPGNTALLSWATANETNTRSFEIEQSLDSRNFNPIATVTANGSGDNNYMQKVSLPADIVYYRLKMIDIEGKFSNSSIIKISVNKNISGIVLMGNPVKNILVLNVTHKSISNTTASIINSIGVTVKTFLLKEGLQNIDVNELPAGNYFIKTNQGSQKIIISR